MSAPVRSSITRWAQRFPFGAACVLISGMLVAVSLFLQSDLRAFAQLQQTRAAEGEHMLSVINRAAQLRADSAAARAAVQRITENLVVEKNIPENFWYFYKIEQDTQTKLVELQQRPTALPETSAPAAYKRVPYSLRVSGEFRGVLAYLQRVETGARLGRVNSFVLQHPSPGSAGMLLVLDVELLAFP